MIAATLGAVIISTATVSMLIAIGLSDKAVKEAGKYPLTNDEKAIVLQVPQFNNTHIDLLEESIQDLSLPNEEN